MCGLLITQNYLPKSNSHKWSCQIHANGLIQLSLIQSCLYHYQGREREQRKEDDPDAQTQASGDNKNNRLHQGYLLSGPSSNVQSSSFEDVMDSIYCLLQVEYLYHFQHPLRSHSRLFIWLLVLLSSHSRSILWILVLLRSHSRSILWLLVLLRSHSRSILWLLVLLRSHSRSFLWLLLLRSHSRSILWLLLLLRSHSSSAQDYQIF